MVPNRSSKCLPNLIVAIDEVEIIRVTLADVVTKVLQLFARDATPTSREKRGLSTENQSLAESTKVTYQCFHLQEPCSSISTQVPKRGSPFMILTFSFL